MENKDNTNRNLFFKAMLITLCVGALLLVGYFGTGYFFGGI